MLCLGTESVKIFARLSLLVQCFEPLYLLSSRQTLKISDEPLATRITSVGAASIFSDKLIGAALISSEILRSTLPPEIEKHV